MKVLLIQPNMRVARSSEGGRWRAHPPIGLCYIAAVLEQQPSVSVSILDANANNLSSGDVIRTVSKEIPDMVGISILSPAGKFARDVAFGLRGKTTLVAGGPHATALPELMLKEGFDVVVRGEGEHAMRDLVTGTKISNVAGVSFRMNERVYHNRDRPFLENIDSLPFPARHLLPSNGVTYPYDSTFTFHHPWAPIVSSRGCPYNCYYCCKLIQGNRIRQRSPENIVSEMEFLKQEYGVKEIGFYDDCFNFDIDWAKRVLDAIIERRLGLTLRFFNGVRADKITEEFVWKLKKAGCEYIAFGIESGDQAVLDKIPKHLKLDQVRRAVKLVRKQGILTTGFFMLGLIGDTTDSMRKTINFAKELDLDVAQFGIATPYPGTVMWKMIQSFGDLESMDWEAFHHTSGKVIFRFPDTASPNEIEDAYRKAHKQFYLRARYILKQIPRIRSLHYTKTMFQGLKSVIDILKER